MINENEVEELARIIDEIAYIRNGEVSNTYEIAENIIKAGYEKIKGNELILKLPCKIGDTVYFPDKENLMVDIGKIECFDIDSNNCKMAYARYKSGLTYWHTFDDFGKEVFLTEEEANRFLDYYRQYC